MDNCTLKQYGARYPINPYTGVDRCTFFPLVKTSRGTIGVFPAYRAPAGTGPYPGLR
jgi:hypothetical protein